MTSTALFRIDADGLTPASRSTLQAERDLEDWIADDLGLIGLDGMLFGRQVRTDNGKLVDLVAIDRDGNIVVIELKRDRTARDVVGQVLDYAAWAKTLSRAEILATAQDYLGEDLDRAYRKRFGEALPDALNASHSMLIVASELDEHTKRIIEYLSDDYDVPINSVFFNVFEQDGQAWLTTDFLLDRDIVEKKATRRRSAPWTGRYFVNAGLSERRRWEDMQRYGFITAGGGEFYSKRLRQLDLGDIFYLYHKGHGYFAVGRVTQTVVRAQDFMTPTGPLLEQDLAGKDFERDGQAVADKEFVVGVEWLNQVPIKDAVTFRGAFANQNIVCKLRDPATLQFLREKLPIEADED